MPSRQIGVFLDPSEAQRAAATPFTIARCCGDASGPCETQKNPLPPAHPIQSSEASLAPDKKPKGWSAVVAHQPFEIPNLRTSRRPYAFLRSLLAARPRPSSPPPVSSIDIGSGMGLLKEYSKSMPICALVLPVGPTPSPATAADDTVKVKTPVELPPATVRPYSWVLSQGRSPLLIVVQLPKLKPVEDS